MMDWEKIINADSTDELKEAKLWLFKEKMRLEKENRELEETRDKFLEERASFMNEMNALNRRSVLERKRLKEESAFFEKKMEILQNGFRQLENDRRQLAQERKKWQSEKEQKADYGEKSFGGETIVELLFRSATNPLILRKRYKDLIKIYHPDNIAGDEELVQMINREFARRRKEDA